MSDFGFGYCFSVTRSFALLGIFSKNSQFCASTARIHLYFCICRSDRFFGNFLKWGFLFYVSCKRILYVGFIVCKDVFDETIFQRMEGDNFDPSS